MNFDVVVIGGGIVGLASAYKILEQRPGTKLLLLEKEQHLAMHQTGNNSGVIHSGIYYKPGSLKAQNCIYGYRLLLSFCREKKIKFELCGKLIIAKNEAELPYLDELYTRGEANGLKGLSKIGPEQIKEIEPYAAGIAAIVVPQTGITNYTHVCTALGDEIRSRGGEIHCSESVTMLRRSSVSNEVITTKASYTAKFILGCAGLQSDRIARMTHPDLPIRIVPFRGEYYKLKPERWNLVKALIYPVPDPNFPFLGVHFTRMIEGGAECGPNAVLAFKREGYKKSDISIRDLVETFAWKGFRKVMYKYWRMGLGEFRRSYSKPAFVRALRMLLPEIQESDLIPGGAGVRAQACDRDGGLIDDFKIFEDGNIIHVCNAPSPAATSSLSIGETVAKMIVNRWN
jgi:L-2-hydroxyglutarate oxidase